LKKDIYIIKNNINDKVYIGQAKNTKKRFDSHCKPSSANDGDLVSVAISKYGKNNFYYEILEEQIEDYNEKELYWIKYYNSIVPNGYNILPGGNEPPVIRGESHPESILSSEQVEQLTNDLKNTELKYTDLANKYGFVSKTSIEEFNYGKTYFRNYIDYPIRKENIIGKLKSSDIDNIIRLLSTTYLSYEEISSTYNVEARTISRINRGLLHHRDNLEYPIRKGSVSGNKTSLTYDNVTEIIKLLKTTKLSLRNIARLYNCEYKVILGIKNGSIKLYRRSGLTYPLRKNN
jgi:group I intron endonuclease